MGCLLQDPYHVTIAAFHPRRQVEQSWSEILEIDFFDIFAICNGKCRKMAKTNLFLTPLG